MDLIKTSKLRICLCLAVMLLTACSVSYKFNGASIDYSKTKTIQINSHTKLSLVRRNGDLKIEGEITQYQQRNKSVSAEGYSAQTELSMTVNVRFTNNTNHAEDFERQFTATSSYETTVSLNAVQDELVTQMCKEICDQIFNATVANW